MAATVRVAYFGGSAGEPAGANAESGIVFSESDAQAPAAGTSPVSIPQATGTAYSWIMQLALEVTATDSTTLTAMDIRRASAPTSGLEVFYGVQPTYRQPAGSNAPPDSGSAGPATPTPTGAGAPGSYVATSTSFVQYDAGGDSASTLGRKGDFTELVAAVDNSYAGGGGQVALPNLEYQYDES